MKPQHQMFGMQRAVTTFMPWRNSRDNIIFIFIKYYVCLYFYDIINVENRFQQKCLEEELTEASRRMCKKIFKPHEFGIKFV